MTPEPFRKRSPLLPLQPQDPKPKTPRTIEVRAVTMPGKTLTSRLIKPVGAALVLFALGVASADTTTVGAPQGGAGACPFPGCQTVSGTLDVSMPPYNAPATGAADASGALMNAARDCLAQGGGIIKLPPGRYALKTSLVWPDGFQGCTIQGSGRDATILDCSTLVGDCMTDGGHTQTVRFVLRDLTIKGALTGASTPNALKLRYPEKDVRLIDVDFDLTTGQGLYVNGATGTLVRGGTYYGHGDFESATQTPRGIRIDGDAADTSIDGAAFEYLYDSIYAVGPAKLLAIRNIRDEHGNSTQTARYQNTTGTGTTYDATSVTDAAAPFAANGVPQFNVVVVLPQIATGTITANTTNTMVDGAASFPATVLRGDRVSTATAFALVETRTNGTTLELLQWRDKVTKRPVAAPVVGTTYILAKTILGEAFNSTNTTSKITVYRWYDATGVDQTPTNGTPYEVQWFRPGYQVKTFTKTDGVTVSNAVFHGASSASLELSGTANTIENNVFRDGIDGGATLNTTAGPSISTIMGNVCDHQSFCIALGNSNQDAWNVVSGNTMADMHWANHGAPPGSAMFGIVLLGAMHSIISDNTIRKGALVAASTVQYGIFAQGSGTASNTLRGNHIDTTFSVAGIRLEDNTVTGTNVLWNDGATVSDGGSTGTTLIDPQTPYAFASLPAYGAGSIVKCTDCTTAAPCAGAGSGSIARYIGAIKNCN